MIKIKKIWIYELIGILYNNKASNENNNRINKIKI